MSEQSQAEDTSSSTSAEGEKIVSEPEQTSEEAEAEAEEVYEEYDTVSIACSAQNV